MSNPFLFGDPVWGADFLNRKRELRRLVGRIRQGGSAVVTAEPRMGKTSLLLHLQRSAADLFVDRTPRVLFGYLDGQWMEGWDTVRFWREALTPLREVTDESLAAALRQAAEQAYDIMSLEAVFRALERAACRLVLLLDEFDALQREAALHRRGFYGALRSLASRHSSFSLVISSRATITDLNYHTREFSQGSPYFNFAQQITLYPFPEKAVAALLARAGEAFSSHDRAFIRRIAGPYPYFLQAAAYYLWEHHTGDDPVTRYERAGSDFFAEAGESVLRDIWDSWTPYMRMAFTLAALDSVPVLLEGRTFDVTGLRADLPYLIPELRKLERRGFLAADADLPGGYRPQAEVMVWYLADELARVLRPPGDPKDWLVAQQWEGLLKRSEKDALLRLLGHASSWFQEGVRAFIRAAAEGVARGMFP